MMAACKRCHVKFFVARHLKARPLDAQAYLWRKFQEHRCKVEDFPTPFQAKSIKSA